MKSVQRTPPAIALLFFNIIFYIYTVSIKVKYIYTINVNIYTIKLFDQSSCLKRTKSGWIKYVFMVGYASFDYLDRFMLVACPLY